MAKLTSKEVSANIAARFLKGLKDAIAAIAAGKPVKFDWVKPWQAAGGGSFGWPVRAASETRMNAAPLYRGKNAMILAFAAADAGYMNRGWMTTMAARSWHAHARRGETGTLIFIPIPRWKKDANGVVVVKDGKKVRDGVYFGVRSVHNLDQMEPNTERVKCVACDGKKVVGERVDLEMQPTGMVDLCETCDGLGWVDTGKPSKKARRFLALKAKYNMARPMEKVPAGHTHWLGDKLLAHYLASDNAPSFTRVASDRAFYRPSAHAIFVPLTGQYKSTAERLGTEYHEAAHSTGHKSLLDRKFGAKFADHKYSEEELVAECASAILRALVGLDDERTDRNSAAYLGHWATKLELEPDLILKAFTAAQKAADLIAKGFDFEQTEPVDPAAHNWWGKRRAAFTPDIKDRLGEAWDAITITPVDPEAWENRPKAKPKKRKKAKRRKARRAKPKTKREAVTV